MPQELKDQLRMLSLPEIPQSEFKNLKNELQRYWESFAPSKAKTQSRPILLSDSKPNMGKRLEGEVIKILHDNERGKDGFIKSKGKEHYFYVNTNFPQVSKIKLGVKVSFEIKPAIGGKKEQVLIKKVIG